MPNEHTPLMDLAWIEDFVAVCRERSFSRAAAARNVTQPAFSRRIRALEDWVGAPLFHRTAQGAVPTAAGEAFQAEAEGLLERATSLRRRALAASRPAVAGLRFAATQTLSFTFFPHWIRSVDDGRTLGQVQLNSVSMAACEAIMRDGEADFMLCHHHARTPPPLGGTLLSTLVGTDRILAVSAPDEAGRPRFAPGPDIVPFLAYTEESMLGRIAEAQLPHILAGLRRRVVLRSHLAAALLSLARDGAGLACLPASLLESDLSAGRLVSIDGAEVPIEIRLFRPATPLSETAERFWHQASVRA